MPKQASNLGNSISAVKVKQHFEQQGFVVTVTNKENTVGCLHFKKNGREAFSVKVIAGRVWTTHLSDMVRRYCEGLPPVNPWTGRV